MNLLKPFMQYDLTTQCPCCSNHMLRHIRSHQAYWFCRHCWQEMPDLEIKRMATPHLRVQGFSPALRVPVSIS